MSDILGQAVFAYYHQHKPQYKLWIHNRYGLKEGMPVETYFRSENDMPDLEWQALNECRGAVLDIGAGAGSHSLILQERGFEVTAIDISPLSVNVMKERGVRNVVEGDIFKYNEARYDTLLLLMNGIGLAGSVDGLKKLLEHFKHLLNKGGQLLFDSSDISYLYEGHMPEGGDYYGELWYQYEYNRKKTEWFKWLYIDEFTMQKIAIELGYQMEVLLEDEYGQYLARLTL